MIALTLADLLLSPSPYQHARILLLDLTKVHLDFLHSHNGRTMLPSMAQDAGNSARAALCDVQGMLKNSGGEA